jgi:hypothetical protein
MASINSQRPPSSLGTFVLGIVCLAVFAMLVVVGIRAVAPTKDTVSEERAAARLKKREELEKDWAAKLTTVAWVDKEKGVVQVPIDEAIKAVAAELPSRKVAKSEVKVPAPLPMPVIDPKATEPPPPALPSAPQGADIIHFPAPPAPAVPAAPATPPPPTPAAPPGPATPGAANPLPSKSALTVSSIPARPPLINWTESK